MSAPSSRAAILAPAADTLLAAVAPPGDSGRVLYVADPLTAEALASAARRMGFTLRPAPPRVWCGDPARDGRAVGTTAELRVDSLVGDRAQVSWWVTCLLLPPGESTPAAGGEMGVLEVVREGGQWRVSRSLMHFGL
jgi:hypothetical protein